MATQFIKNTLQTVIDWANLSNYSTADTLSFACEKHLEEKTKDLKKKQDEQEQEAKTKEQELQKRLPSGESFL